MTKQLPEGAGQLLEDGDYIGERTFLVRALAKFPELRADPDIQIGVHLSMAALARLTMSALRAGDSTRATEVFAFLDEILRDPRVHHEVRNAVAISFVIVSDLVATDVGAKVWASAPDSVRRLLEEEYGE